MLVVGILWPSIQFFNTIVKMMVVMQRFLYTISVNVILLYFLFYISLLHKNVFSPQNCVTSIYRMLTQIRWWSSKRTLNYLWRITLLLFTRTQAHMSVHMYDGDYCCHAHQARNMIVGFFYNCVLWLRLSSSLFFFPKNWKTTLPVVSRHSEIQCSVMKWLSLVKRTVFFIGPANPR